MTPAAYLLLCADESPTGGHWVMIDDKPIFVEEGQPTQPYHVQMAGMAHGIMPGHQITMHSLFKGGHFPTTKHLYHHITIAKGLQKAFGFSPDQSHQLAHEEYENDIANVHKLAEVDDYDAKVLKNHIITAKNKQELWDKQFAYKAKYGEEEEDAPLEDIIDEEPETDPDDELIEDEPDWEDLLAGFEDLPEREPPAPSAEELAKQSRLKERQDLAAAVPPELLHMARQANPSSFKKSRVPDHADLVRGLDAKSQAFISRGQNVDNITERQNAKRSIQKTLGARIAADQMTIGLLTAALERDTELEDKMYKTNFDHLRGEETQNVAESAVNEIVHAWAEASHDNNRLSALMQYAAHLEFGTPESSWDISHDILNSKARNYVDMAPDESISFARSFLRHMYDHTQEQLEAQGLEEVYLSRGMGFSNEFAVPEWGQGMSKGEFRDSDVGLAPLSSFTSEHSTSTDFARGNAVPMKVHAVIPKERVLGTARTGFGCLNEWEYVVLSDEGANYRVERL